MSKNLTNTPGWTPGVPRGPAAGGPPVQRLPDALVDQIAAGEVVERPASVVKELVENALDAGAGRVRVEVRGGGRDFIAVTDDGCGMQPDDARRALERHATSKIAQQEDLQHIASFGFRGEALPAIASVSKLRLRTRPRGAEAAFELRVEAGRLVEARSVGGPEGTRVEVSDLFAAIPARRKFLKAASTEWGHAAEWLTRAALALPHVHFDVRRDDRPALAWPSVSDPLDRIAAVLGETEAQALLPVQHEEGPARLEGYVSRPDHHRSTLSGVYLFVNRRPVRDRLLQHALLEVYRDMLPRGRFPTAVLFLSVPATAVDVNVHPAKWEVRFVDPRWTHRFVRHAVRGAIARRGWLDAEPRRAAPESGADPGHRFDGAGRSGGTEGALAFRETGGATGAPGDWIFAAAPDPDRARASEGAVSFVSDSPRIRFRELRRLGQLLGTYLVLEAKDRLLLVDQHAAHERVLYERLRADWAERRVARQGLLAPLAVELAPRALATLLEQAGAVADLGFEVEAFGEDAVAVRAVPALLSDRDPAALVRGLADELVAAGAAADATRASARPLEAADRAFATLACHSARRKGDVLDPLEQQALLEALDTIPWAPTCPHGRPVVVPIGLDEIERRFGRR